MSQGFHTHEITDAKNIDTRVGTNSLLRMGIEQTYSEE